MPAVYLFYGPDQAALNQKLKKWLERFKSKYDYVFDYLRIDARTVNFNEIIEVLLTVGILSQSRLIIIDGLLSSIKTKEQEKLLPYLSNLSPGTTILLVEEKPTLDKGTIFDWLKTCGHIEYFAESGQTELRKEMLRLLREKGVSIDNRAIPLLMSRVNNSAATLCASIDILSLYKDSGQITAEDVEMMISPSAEPQIFRLFDAIQTNRDRAVRLMESELIHGTHPLQIVAVLMSQTRKKISDGLGEALYPKYCNYFHRLCLMDFDLKTGADAREVLSLCRFL